MILRKNWFIGTPWVLLLIALFLYLWTLDNGLQSEELRGGDLITHQYAQVQARPSNAPGYPLYTMGGWLWFRAMRGFATLVGNPYPNPMPLLSSYSTLWALLALWLLFRILIVLFLRVRYAQQSPQSFDAQGSLALGTSLNWLFSAADGVKIHDVPRITLSEWLPATLITLFYGVTYFFWYYATTTEQYSSAIAQTLAIVNVYLLWQDSNSVHTTQLRTLRDPAARLLLLLALLCGLSLAHMLTVAFIVPPLLLVMLWQRPTLLRQWRIILLAIIVALLPLTSYLYIYLRGAAHPEWWGSGEWHSTQEWFWSFVSTSQGREELGWGFEPWCTPFANEFPMLIVQELSGPVVILGLLGFCLMGRRLAMFFWGTTAIYLAFNWAYRCGNWFQVILPLYPLLVIGFGFALYKLLFFVAQGVSAKQQSFSVPSIVKGLCTDAESLRWYASMAVSLLLLLAIFVRINTQWSAVNSRNRADDSALDHAAVLLTEPLPEQQALFASLDDTLALQYVTQIWNIRPDLRMISSQQAATELASGKAIYSTWDLAPTLRAELPQQGDISQLAVDPLWIRFDSTDGQEYFMRHWLDWAFHPTSQLAGKAPLDTLEDGRQILTQRILEEQLLPTIRLQAYRVERSAPSLLMTSRTANATDSGLDLMLLWQVERGVWPGDVAISLRLSAAGNSIEGAQIDRQEPAEGLNQGTTDLLPDPYLFAVSATDLAAVDGAVLILYRATDNGFENLAILPLPW